MCWLNILNGLFQGQLKWTHTRQTHTLYMYGMPHHRPTLGFPIILSVNKYKYLIEYTTTASSALNCRSIYKYIIYIVFHMSIDDTLWIESLRARRLSSSLCLCCAMCYIRCDSSFAKRSHSANIFSCGVVVVVVVAVMIDTFCSMYKYMYIYIYICHYIDCVPSHSDTQTIDSSIVWRICYIFILTL